MNVSICGWLLSVVLLWVCIIIFFSGNTNFFWQFCEVKENDIRRKPIPKMMKKPPNWPHRTVMKTVHGRKVEAGLSRCFKAEKAKRNRKKMKFLPGWRCLAQSTNQWSYFDCLLRPSLVTSSPPIKGSLGIAWSLSLNYACEISSNCWCCCIQYGRWDLMGGNFVEGPRMNGDAPRGASAWEKVQVMEGEIEES